MVDSRGSGSAGGNSIVLFGRHHESLTVFFFFFTNQVDCVFFLMISIDNIDVSSSDIACIAHTMDIPSFQV